MSNAITIEIIATKILLIRGKRIMLDRDLELNSKNRGLKMVITFRDDVPIEETMVFEEVYEEELREDLETKQDMRDRGYMMYMFVDGELAGEIYAMTPCYINPDEDAAVLADVVGNGLYDGGKTLYCSSNTILPKFQGLGLGKLFKAYFLGYAKGLAFDKLIGHNTHDKVSGINEFFGGKVLCKTENWYGTGKTAEFYRIDL